MDAFVEAAVRQVLTAADPGTTGFAGGAGGAGVDTTVADAALLLACVGGGAESDRLVRHWRATTGRPATALVPDAVTARAWAMVFEARGFRPDWAAELLPLDLDAEEVIQRDRLARYLDETTERDEARNDGGGTAERGAAGGDRADAGAPEAAVPGTGAGDESTGARRRKRRRRGHTHEASRLAVLAERDAAGGDRAGALDALGRWAELAGTMARPDVATLAACRHVAPLLVRGAIPTPEGWAHDYAGALIAALHARSSAGAPRPPWPDLIAEILRLRGTPGVAPPPATEAGLAATQHRLGVSLPYDYREFLSTCDGLPADVVFPRLLGTAELGRAATPAPAAAPGPEAAAVAPADVVLSDPATIVLRPATGAVFEYDPVFGVTEHASVRALLTGHRELLEAAR